MLFPIRYKLASLIFIILFPLMGFSGFHLMSMTAKNRADIKASNLELVHNIGNDLDKEIETSFNVLNALALHPAVQANNAAESDRLFAELLPRYPLHLNILAADMKGFNIGSGVPSADVRTLNYLDKEWFQKGSLGKPVVGNLHVSKLFKMPSVMIAQPVFLNGVQTGVLGFPLDLRKLRGALVKKHALPANSVIRILDRKGMILIDTLNDSRIGEDNSKVPLAPLKLDTTTGDAELAGADGVKRIYSFDRTPLAGWTTLVGVPVEHAYRKAYRHNSEYLFAIVVVCSIALSLSLLISNHITRRIDKIRDYIQESGQNRRDVTLKIGGHDELNILAETFNRMSREQQATELKLKESEAFLSSVLDGIGEGVVVIDPTFRIKSANNGYCRQVKIPGTDIIGHYCYEISHQIDVPCFEQEGGCECPVKRCFETGEQQRSIHTHYDSEGGQKYIETNAYPLRDKSGNISTAIETLKDVTDRVSLERRLEDAKEQYRKLYDNAPDMMHSINQNGDIIYCNRTGAIALGTTVEAIVGKPFARFVAPEARLLWEEKFKVLKNTGQFEGELTLSTAAGSVIPVVAKAKAIYSDSGDFIMADAVLRDITEKKALEAQLLQAQKMEAVGQLAGGIAHDFNNILTVVIGYGTLLLRDMAEEDPHRQYVDQILTASDQASKLTRGLLAFSRKQIISLRPVDVNLIIRGVTGFLERILSEDIELHLDLTDQDTTIMVDSGQLEQILMNLATNAHDAIPEQGEVTIETSVLTLDPAFRKVHGFGEPGDYVLITITDTGVGMDEETQQKIFEPFFTTKETGKGTGLGLSVVYGIIKQHNGFITAYSEPGRGTTFRIYFPAVKEKGETPPAETFCTLPEGHETILLAEDNTEVRKLTREVLESSGYTVIEAEDGEEAIRLFSEHKDAIHLAILDVVMPKKNGKEVYDAIRALTPNVRTIFTSGYTANVIHKKGILQQGLNFISKPVAPQELLGMIKNILGGS